MPVKQNGLYRLIRGVTMSDFFYVDDVAFPCPVHGMEYLYTDAVNNGRNSEGTMIGERVGRTQVKLNNLEWKMLDAEVVHRLIQAFDPFFVVVHFFDLREWDWIDVKMYPGDRTAMPYYRMDGGIPDKIESFKVNIIDCGEL